MARFLFNLQRVLDIRKQEEKVMQNALAVEVQKELEFRRRIAQLEDERTAAQALAAGLSQSGGVSGLQFHQQQMYVESVERRIARAHADLDGQLKQVEAVRLELIAAAKKRMVLEKLREKRLAAFKKELEAAEQKDIDEIGQRLSARSVIRSGSSGGTDAAGEVGRA